ncbi:hypothetical protein NDU88_000854 [Pleurodeles waltl]|uniref:Uncharacterized protein n=1 Tax=Pleurodeles waltl TaxID=8319 RepID=A0AAV7MI14_PLEWA|nr:hypothetical protein NDU88_000854 [Pleurodeles waltl]
MVPESTGERGDITEEDQGVTKKEAAEMELVRLQCLQNIPGDAGEATPGDGDGPSLNPRKTLDPDLKAILAEHLCGVDATAVCDHTINNTSRTEDFIVIDDKTKDASNADSDTGFDLVNATVDATVDEIHQPAEDNLRSKHTSSSKVSTLPPRNFIDSEESEKDDDGPFGAAHSPSELHVKYQEEENDDEYYAQVYH